jgi:hypothetical protein
VTRKRLEITDARPDELSGRRMARWLKNAAIYGFRAGPVYPLADTPETPRALAERMIQAIPTGDHTWDVWWVTETGSRIYCLEIDAAIDRVDETRLFWVEVVARLLEHGGRLYRGGEMEIKG